MVAMRTSFNWTELDSQAVITAKALAADAVETAGSGHPGSAISLAGPA
jgi:transketolase